jgi:hypothetical protein
MFASAQALAAPPETEYCVGWGQENPLELTHYFTADCGRADPSDGRTYKSDSVSYLALWNLNRVKEDLIGKMKQDGFEQIDTLYTKVIFRKSAGPVTEPKQRCLVVHIDGTRSSERQLPLCTAGTVLSIDVTKVQPPEVMLGNSGFRNVAHINQTSYPKSTIQIFER